MPTYVVYLSAAVTTTVEVEADNAEAAEKAAYQEVHVSLCHECAGKMNPPEEWAVEEVEQVAGGT